jgi:hypothetical protein
VEQLPSDTEFKGLMPIDSRIERTLGKTVDKRMAIGRRMIKEQLASDAEFKV